MQTCKRDFKTRKKRQENSQRTTFRYEVLKEWLALVTKQKTKCGSLARVTQLKSAFRIIFANRKNVNILPRNFPFLSTQLFITLFLHYFRSSVVDNDNYCYIFISTSANCNQTYTLLNHLLPNHHYQSYK
jgi:hypothetical protein